MNSAEIRSDLDRRETRFTISHLDPVGLNDLELDIFPFPHVWFGFDNPGPTNEILPVLFGKDSTDPNNLLVEIDNFDWTEADGHQVGPLAYSDSDISMGPVTVDIQYDVKSITEDVIGFDVDSEDDVIEAATTWVNDLAQKSLQMRRVEAGHGGLELRMQIRVYGEKFVTRLPIFEGCPSESELKSALEKTRIPCVSIVPPEIDAKDQHRFCETIVKPGIIRI